MIIQSRTLVVQLDSAPHEAVQVLVRAEDANARISNHRQKRVGHISKATSERCTYQNKREAMIHTIMGRQAKSSLRNAATRLQTSQHDYELHLNDHLFSHLAPCRALRSRT
jgi:hypothetical protein